MRIAMIAPLELRVPPLAYGGIELIVSLLTEELVLKGHDVTLFASGDSQTSARLESVCSHFLRGSGRDKGILNIISVASCLEQADKFDIIHNHTLFEGFSMAGLVSTPMLSTLHGGLKGDWLTLFDHYRGWYNTISRSAKTLLPEKSRFAGVIYNAIDTDSYPFNGAHHEPYLLFLSRLSREKGPDIAIDVARALGARLIIAGNIDLVDESFFKEEVLPKIDGHQVQYVGEADYNLKRELMSQAHCLLAPITWEEPFGLFMIEAMACGTPVVAFARGAAPELVVDGVTGFVVDTFQEMVNAVGKVHMIDPVRCREHVESRFGVRRMVNRYVEAYERIVAGVSVPAALSAATYAELDDRGTATVAGGLAEPERLATAADPN